MITALEESILDLYYRFVLAVKEKQYKDADNIHKEIHSLLKEEPDNRSLYEEFLEMDSLIVEYGDNYEAIASAYNALVYEFNKLKYPDKYKDL